MDDQSRTNGENFVRQFDPNLMEALARLGETFGPLGVALAAATRAEPEAVLHGVADLFETQRALWMWVRSDRYKANLVELPKGTCWQVVDTYQVPDLVAEVYSGPNGVDPEAVAGAMAEHLNVQETRSRLAAASVDNSHAGQE